MTHSLRSTFDKEFLFCSLTPKKGDSTLESSRGMVISNPDVKVAQSRSLPPFVALRVMARHLALSSVQRSCHIHPEQWD
jgi:hypothetical protein